jgi:hypothetical protein
LRFLVLVPSAFVVLGLGEASAQELAALRPRDRVQITLVSDSTVDGTIQALWPPDSLRLRSRLDGRDAVYRRQDMAHLDVLRNHGMTGVKVGLVVGAVTGVLVYTAFGETSTQNVLTGALVGAVVVVPIAGMVGSLAARWDAVF